MIRGHPDARFIATVNPVKSEGRGIYEGKVMSGEFTNRFTNKVHLRYLPPDQEFEVLKDYGPGVDDALIDRLVAWHHDHPGADYMESTVGFPPSPGHSPGVAAGPSPPPTLEPFPGDWPCRSSAVLEVSYWARRTHSSARLASAG